MTEVLTAHRALVNWAAKSPKRAFLHQPVNGEVRTFTRQQSADAARRTGNDGAFVIQPEIHAFYSKSPTRQYTRRFRKETVMIVCFLTNPP